MAPLGYKLGSIIDLHTVVYRVSLKIMYTHERANTIVSTEACNTPITKHMFRALLVGVPR